MKKLLTVLLISFGVILPNAFPQQPDLPEKVDEFYHLPLEHLLARLDRFKYIWYKTTDSVAQITAYRKADFELGTYDNRRSFIEFHLLQPPYKISRLRIIKAGFSDQIEFEFWLSKGFELIKPNSSVLKPEEEKNTFLYFTNWYSLPSEKDFPDIYEHDFDWDAAAYKNFAELLKATPESKAYLIAYTGRFDGTDYRGKKTDPPTLANTMLGKAKRALGKYGIPASQIKTIRGGYRKNDRVIELFLARPGSFIPVATPNYFPKGRSKIKAKKMTTPKEWRNAETRTQ